MADSSPSFFKCSKCAIFFATLPAAQQHTCAGHENEDVNLSPEETENTLFTCTKCNGWFVNKQQYAAHPCTATDHESDDEPVASGSRPSAHQDISESQGTSSKWHKSAILKLIQEFHVRKEKQELRFKKKNMWAQIHEEMCKEGYAFTLDQISGRWKSLMRAYRNTKDHNAKSGNSRTNFEFESDLDKIFERDPSISPEVTRSSSSKASKKPLSDIPDDSDSEARVEPERKKRATCKRSSSSKDLVETFKTYIEDQKKSQAEERNKREEMHEQKLDLMKSLISAISGSQNQGVPRSQGQGCCSQGQSVTRSQAQGIQGNQGHGVSRSQTQSHGSQAQCNQQWYKD